MSTQEIETRRESQETGSGISIYSDYYKNYFNIPDKKPKNIILNFKNNSEKPKIIEQKGGVFRIEVQFLTEEKFKPVFKINHFNPLLQLTKSEFFFVDDISSFTVNY